MTKAKKPRNRAAQDTTLINLRALKARVKTLEAKVKAIEAHLSHANQPWYLTGQKNKG